MPSCFSIECNVPPGIRPLSSGIVTVLWSSPGLPLRAHTRCVPRLPLPSLRVYPCRSTALMISLLDHGIERQA